ncbi:MAG: UDP-N-acetylmuramoyl-L-alanyl-D-glutamate--2,6-diaminopimelate ligase [Gammaproteobacteria bacterium]|nr:UDP-N-acetylmuramoyl-L-alanyl-D-glutamate--2,6-diaminopimelate ligase [Gammaproteobacteria bacterium]
MEFSNWLAIENTLQKAQVNIEPSARLIQDSRNIKAGDIFVALKGLDQDGSAYIDKALSADASAVLVSSNCDSGNVVEADNVIVVDDLENRLAAFSREFYLKDTSVPMPVIGVTGTNGKTSVSHFLAQLSQVCLKQEAAVIGTMGAGAIESLEVTANTTPSVTEIFRLISEFSQQEFGSLSMEVSSHALDQGRIQGVDFDVAIFTNLTLDHLDYHGDMESYFQAKLKLFTEFSPKCAVVNIDDEYGVRIAQEVSDNIRVIAYGQSEQVKAYSDYVYLASYECHEQGLVLDVEWQVIGTKEKGQLLLPIYGEFNGMNICAVFATALALNWPVLPIHFSQLKPVPGRLESFVAPQYPIALVDYAHTPDALEQSLKAVRKHLTGSLYVIFGCGGDRDTSKRPIMGQIAEQLADHVIITNDNPRTELPENIISEIQVGMNNKQHKVILSRKEAIQYALKTATVNDAILIAGKGHETYQVVGQQVVDYHEREYVKNLMTQLSQGKAEL